MKTIRQWLNELPEHLRDRAIRNAVLQEYAIGIIDLNHQTRDVYEAIASAFVWSHTPEGFDYWSDAAIYISFLNDYQNN